MLVRVPDPNLQANPFLREPRTRGGKSSLQYRASPTQRPAIAPGDALPWNSGRKRCLLSASPRPIVPDSSAPESRRFGIEVEQRVRDKHFALPRLRQAETARRATAPPLARPNLLAYKTEKIPRKEPRDCRFDQNSGHWENRTS